MRPHQPYWVCTRPSGYGSLARAARARSGAPRHGLVATGRTRGRRPKGPTRATASPPRSPAPRPPTRSAGTADPDVIVSRSRQRRRRRPGRRRRRLRRRRRDLLAGGDGNDRRHRRERDRHPLRRRRRRSLVGGNGPDRVDGGQEHRRHSTAATDPTAAMARRTGCENIPATPDPLAALGPAPPGLVRAVRARASEWRSTRTAASARGISGQRRPGGDADRARRARLAGLRLHAAALRRRLHPRADHDPVRRGRTSALSRRPSFGSTPSTRPRALARRRGRPGRRHVSDTVSVTVAALLRLRGAQARRRRAGRATGRARRHAAFRPTTGRPARSPLDLAFVLDESGSMASTIRRGCARRRERGRRPARRVSDLDRVGVVSFNSGARPDPAHAARRLLERGRGQGGDRRASSPRRHDIGAGASLASTSSPAALRPAGRAS